MEAAVRRRSADVETMLNERQRRLWAAAEAKTAGYGGVSLVARATGISRRAIHVGLCELEAADALPTCHIRRPGGGRKRLTVLQPTLKDELDGLVEPTARSDPESPLRWTCKSVRRLAVELQRQGFSIGRQKVADLLHELGYSLQANRRTREGTTHPDRNAQFEYINRQVQRFQRQHQPVISVEPVSPWRFGREDVVSQLDDQELLDSESGCRNTSELRFLELPVSRRSRFGSVACRFRQATSSWVELIVDDKNHLVELVRHRRSDRQRDI